MIGERDGLDLRGSTGQREIWHLDVAEARTWPNFRRRVWVGSGLGVEPADPTQDPLLLLHSLQLARRLRIGASRDDSPGVIRRSKGLLGFRAGEIAGKMIPRAQ